MIRNDFVSNSSSSSFIVTSEDNKFDILLRDYDVLTLEEYIKHYFREDLMYCSTRDDFNIENYTFLSNAEYNKRFSTGTRKCLPKSCKNNMEAYLTLVNNRPDGKWDSDEVTKWSENLDKIFEDIKKKVYEALKLKWKDVKFHVAEVNDNFIADDRDDFVDTEEELVEERIDYMNSLKPLKFYRTFCHH